MSARNALYNYLDKHARENKGLAKPRRKNKTPEDDLRKKIIITCKKDGFKLYITDSKARWSNEADGYISEKYDKGMSDVSGDKEGIACYVEIKAPGKLSTLKPHQREFLLEKIRRGCFAVCVDSYELLYNTWLEWFNRGKYKNILINALPREPISRDANKPLFDHS